MSYRSLRDFIARREAEGELVRVKEPVSTVLEMMGVTMNNVERRDAASMREVGEVLATLRQPEPPRSFGEAMELLPLARTVMSMRPKTVGSPACQQIVLRGGGCRRRATKRPSARRRWR